MAGSKRPRKVPAGHLVADVTVDFDLMLTPLAWLDDGFAIPSVFQVTAPTPGGDDVVIDVRVEDKRARARSVFVLSKSKGGVSSTVLRSIQIREIVAKGCRKALHRMKKDSSTQGFRLVQAAGSTSGDKHAEAEATRLLVGYVDVTP